MKKLTTNGVQTVATSDGVNPTDIYDSTGTGLLPIQARVTGVATFRVLARVASDAPWVEIIAAGTIGFLQSISWVPQIQLEQSAGAGGVDLWIGEK